MSDWTSHSSVNAANTSVYEWGKIVLISILINTSENIPDGTALITLPTSIKNSVGYCYKDLFDQSGNTLNGRIAIEPNSNIIKVYWSDGIRAGQQMRGNIIFAKV